MSQNHPYVRSKTEIIKPRPPNKPNKPSKIYRFKQHWKRVEKIFAEFDKNGDEKLSQEEFHTYLKKKEDMSNEAFELLFAEIDVDDGGDITKEELFSYYMRQEPDFNPKDCPVF